MPVTRRACRSCRRSRPPAMSPSPAGSAIPWRCGAPATTRACTPASRRKAGRRAPSSTRSNRPASRRSARAPCAALPTTSRPCWRTSISRANLAQVTDKAEAPLEEAIALMVREKLTGRAAPRSGESLVGLWRDYVEDKAGADIEGLLDKLDDQQGFRPRRARHAGLHGHGRGARRRGSGRTRARTRTTSPRARSRARKAASRIPAPRTPRPSSPTPRPRTRRPARSETSDAEAEEMQDEDFDAETPGETKRPNDPFANLPREIDYRVFTTEFDETVGAEELCEEEELDRLRAFLDKQLANLQGVVGRLANRLQRRLMAQQNRSWDFDLEEGYLDPARLAAHRHRPDAAALLQAGARHPVPRHGRHPASRQFRLDARPPDHGRGDLRRHPGAHAGALRRLGRDSRLHHARLEGRAGAREMAEERQARQSRPAQRSAPHRLQVGRRALAARPAQSRPDDARGAAQGKHRRRGAAVGAQPADRARPSSARS